MKPKTRLKVGVSALLCVVLLWAVNLKTDCVPRVAAGALRRVVEVAPNWEKWSGESTQQEDPSDEYNRGMAYYNGQGVPQDHQEAAKWFRKAAEQGDAAAQFNLGVMYYEGEGLLRDCKEAAKCYTRAAEGGQAAAQFKLGVMCYKGEGVLEDYVEAYKWALLAAMDKADAADVLKEILREKMTPGQIEDAQREAKEFLAQQEHRSKGDKQAPETIRATGESGDTILNSRPQ